MTLSAAKGARGGYGPLLVGLACVVVALFALSAVMLIYGRWACGTTGALPACIRVSAGAALIGFVGCILLLRHVATPSRD